MKTFAIAATFGVASAIHQLELKYMNYLAQFGKNMNSIEEFETRLEHFTATDIDIEEMNAQGNTWTAGHNQFSDWSQEEYKSILGLKMTAQNAETVVFDESNLQTTVNWKTAGAVTDVKNQGSCGSCWSFSSTGALEGAHYITKNELKSFSEQQLVDCADSNYGNYGCGGGNPLNSFHYYQYYEAILESEYQYTSGNGDDSTSCLQSSKSISGVYVEYYQNVQQNSSSQMKAALSKQPLSVLIEADQRAFQTYKNGVLTGSACGTNLDHAVLAVGYGSENGQEYWLVKNSWATTWGDEGYIKLGMDSSTGTCGVQMGPSFPTAV